MSEHRFASMRLGRVLAAAALGLLAAGCTANSGAVGEKGLGAGDPAGGAASETVRVQVADREAFQKVIDSHRGQVVLVDFWATWCPPCVGQFPHTVALWRRHREAGLAVVSVSFDDPDEIETVRKFLADHGATFDNLLSQYGAQESAETFDVDNGAIPDYWVYDRGGALAKRISPADPTAKFRPEMIDEAVAELLAQPAP